MQQSIESDIKKEFLRAQQLISEGGDAALQGIALFETLAQQQYRPAKISLAIQKLKSSPPTYDAAGAKLLLESINNDETGTVNYLLAECYAAELLEETPASTTKERVHKHFLKAAESGHVEAMLQLAYGYRHGIFSQQSDDKGCFWLQQAIKKNHPRALFELAIHKGYGIGCEQNLSQAEDYLERVLPFNYPNAAAFKNNFKAKQADNLMVDITFDDLHQTPQITSLHRVLDVMECSHLAVLSMPFLTPSKVISSSGTAQKVTGRSSMGTNFPPFRADFVVNSIVLKLSKIAGQAATTSEFLALLKYGEGEEYRVHPDYFDSSREGMDQTFKRGGQRIKTIVCYLNSVVEGGKTIFPDLDIGVSAVAGEGVFFENAQANGAVYPESRHAGLPIIQGSKWIVTLWFRENSYRNL